ncbi:uncharacterized protein LOC124146355 isoform X2 [Haliotis rufescens]|uniref:uncharacterized protein LOC124146355 isoform X2 n=1 Tax=Haliotis rufescens TaxID=6454 RepID=UPI00201FAD16|nr:uncharacterized protein LOC124146355 isoform X2 [Haliotis rufescens]
MLSKLKAVHVLGAVLAIIGLSQVCDAITRANKDTLTHHMLDTLAYVHLSNKTSFVKFCLRRHICSSKAFAPRPGYFHWKDGTTKAEKDVFWQTYKCVLKTDITLCPIDGQWSLWAEWSGCSAGCQGVGNRTRGRQCNNPLPANHGLKCFGRFLEKADCNGQCNDSAMATGLQEAGEHLKEVHKAIPQLGIECMYGHCTYETLKKYLPISMRDKYWSDLICAKYKRACPVDGGWSAWGVWSECTVPCGNGYLYRHRTCDSPHPINGGQACPGPVYEKKSCVAKNCYHIKGDEKAVFSEWSAFSPCSVSCGTYGTQVTRRSCLLKKKCLVRGETVDNLIISRPCFQGACPKKGGWSDWSEWTVCSAVCGEGRKTRLRMCADPYPSGGGGCFGPEVDTSDCKRSQRTRQNKSTPGGIPQLRAAKPRKVTPAWGDPYNQPYDRSRESQYQMWSDWSTCSRSCGGGYRKRDRGCEYTVNATCCGEIRQIQFCNIAQCPVKGGWSDWMQWSTCDVTCGPGSRRRFRRCDNPLPANGGPCIGENGAVRYCRNAPCQEPDDHWSRWSTWSSCDKTCGQGHTKRVRQWRGDGEEKKEDMKALCNLHACPVTGKWGAWGQWAPCSKECGLGHNFRDRTCTDPAPFNNGKICRGPGTESTYCYNRPCQGNEAAVKFNKNSYLTYSPHSKPIRYLLIYLRLKPLSPSGTLVYRHRGCMEGTFDCDHNLVLSLKNYRPFLGLTIDGRDIELLAKTSVKASEWNDLLVFVSRVKSYIRVNDGEHTTFIPDSPFLEEMNLDGSMRVGTGETGNDGFHGVISILRINFKDIALYQSPFWLGIGAPDKEEFIEKQLSDVDVNYPDFRGRHYARLSFRHDRMLKIVMTVRMRKSNGFILYNEGVVPGSLIALFSEQGALKLCFACNKKDIFCQKTFIFQTRTWYYLTIEAEGNGSVLRLDKGEAMQLSCVGRNYRPQKEVFIGGAPPHIWALITNRTGVRKGFDGNVDKVVVNDETFSFRRGALFDTAGTINSMGYSFSTHVSNVIEHSTSKVTLRCDFTSFTTGDHDAKAQWLLEDRLLNSTHGVHIRQRLPGLQNESSVTLMPESHTQGLYACVVNQDGRLLITHAFAITRSNESLVLKVTPEWTIIIVLIVIVVFIFIAAALLVKKDAIKKMATGSTDDKAQILEDIHNSLNKPDLVELTNMSVIQEEDEGEDATIVSAMDEPDEEILYDVKDIEFSDDEDEKQQDVDATERMHQLGSQVAARLIEENKDKVLELISSMVSLNNLRDASSRHSPEPSPGHVKTDSFRRVPSVPQPGSSLHDVNSSARRNSSSRVQKRSSPSPPRRSPIPGAMVDDDQDMSPERRWSVSHRSSGSLSPSRRASISPRRLSQSISPPKASAEYVNNARPLDSPRHGRPSPPLEYSDPMEFSDPPGFPLEFSDPSGLPLEFSGPPMEPPELPHPLRLPPGILGPPTPPGFGGVRQLPVMQSQRGTPPPSPPELPPPH